MSAARESSNTLDMPGMPLHNTTLKVGCPIILLRNLEQPAGLCNGTRMSLQSLKREWWRAMILMGSHAGKRAFIITYASFFLSHFDAASSHFALRI